jgi:hypothetical protein
MHKVIISGRGSEVVKSSDTTVAITAGGGVGAIDTAKARRRPGNGSVAYFGKSVKI